MAGGVGHDGRAANLNAPGRQAGPRVPHSSRVNPRNLPHTTAGSLIYPLYFWTNYSQARSNRADLAVIRQLCHLSIQHGGCPCQ